MYQEHLLKTSYIFAALLVLSVIPSSVLASGFAIATHGAKAVGVGTAFVAMADDPSAVYYNPAGLAGLNDPEMYLGATALSPSTTFENAAGAKEETEDQVFVPPHLYAVYPYSSLTFGIGVYSPFGMGTRWRDTGLTRYLATDSESDTININPAVAMRVRPWLMLGAGIDYMRSKAVLKKMVDQSSVGGGDAQFSLSGDGNGWGYNAGFIILPDERLRFGVSYRSGIRVEYSGTVSLDNIAPAVQPFFGGASYKTSARTSIRFPDILTIGAAFKPSDKTTVEVDFERTGWSSYDRLDVDLENEVAAAGFTDSTEAKDWKDVWAIKAGIEYRATERISLRGGYVYENNPVPDHTLEPSLPDSDQYDFSAGIGYRDGNLVVDFAYMAAFYEDRTVSNDLLSGRYESLVHLFALSAGYKF